MIYLRYVLAILTLIFVFLPWASGAGFFTYVSMSGTDHWLGIMALLVTLATIVGDFIATTKKFTSLSMGFVAFLALFFILSIAFTQGVHVGAGVVLTFICSLAATYFFYIDRNNPPIDLNKLASGSATHAKQEGGVPEANQMAESSTSKGTASSSQDSSTV